MARILFLDDDPITLHMLSKIVELAGHEPLIAVTGAEALEIAGVQRPDMIILDMNMPDMDGITVIESLRAEDQTAHIPALILSAAAEVDFGDKVRAAGGQEYLQKPMNMAKLLEIIEKYLPRAEA